MNYRKVILVGNVGVDAKTQQSKNGDVSYTRFSVGVGSGEEKTTFFPVTVFGEYGEKIAEYVTKGRQLLVEGRVNVGKKGFFNVVADRVLLGVLPAESGKK